MKSRILFNFLIFLFVSFFCKAQIKISSVGNSAPQMEVTIYDTLDYAKVRCQYKQLVVENVAQPRKKSTDIMLLQIGKNLSKYTNYSRLMLDSTMESKLRAGINGVELLQDAVNSRGRVHDGSKLLKGYPTGKTTFMNSIAAITYFYEEDLLKQDWHLLPDTATVLGYVCKKAICTFRCRDYEAWYAPEIPLSEGPWKFSGLPGLILKVSDIKKEFSFEAIAIEKIEWVDPITISLSTAFKSSKEKYLKAYKNYMDNPVAALKSVDSNLNLPENVKSRPYNLIEQCE
jgi:GLPGLI family protein